MLASITTYPHEVLRTRLQMIPHTPHRTYSGFIQAIGVIARHEGIRGFYKGMGVNLIRTVPNSGLTILTYVSPRVVRSLTPQVRAYYAIRYTLVQPAQYISVESADCLLEWPPPGIVIHCFSTSSATEPRGAEPPWARTRTTLTSTMMAPGRLAQSG